MNKASLANGVMGMLGLQASAKECFVHKFVAPYWEKVSLPHLNVNARICKYPCIVRTPRPANVYVKKPSLKHNGMEVFSVNIILGI